MKTKNNHITENIVWVNSDEPKEVFERIYAKNYWNGEESVSGKGSEKTAVANISDKLPELFRKLNVSVIVDSPCGDYFWMKDLDFDFRRYVGIDIVESIINDNKKKYEKENVFFLCADITETITEKADLILCRDCFIHFSFKDIFATLKNFKESSSSYLLTTTYKNINENTDIYTGGFRKINLLLPPFNFPAPEFEICEENDKYLSLWRISDL